MGTSMPFATPVQYSVDRVVFEFVVNATWT
jgi:hypothetical protein